MVRGLGMRHSVFTITSAASVRTSALIAIRSADGSSEARGVHPCRHAEGARDGDRGELAIAYVVAGLDQNEPERDDGHGVDRNDNRLGIEEQEQDRRRGQTESEADRADCEPGDGHHQRRYGGLDGAQHVIRESPARAGMDSRVEAPGT